jgi:hypothetical protein
VAELVTVPRDAGGELGQLGLFPDLLGFLHEVFRGQADGRVRPVAGGVDEDLGAAELFGVGALVERGIDRRAGGVEVGVATALDLDVAVRLDPP